VYIKLAESIQNQPHRINSLPLGTSTSKMLPEFAKFRDAASIRGYWPPTHPDLEILANGVKEV
jgi:hypothetical protein